jgi:hypothetical protein
VSINPNTKERLMATVTWEIHGREYANCNCSYGCPCQFSAPPTHGFCCAVGGFQIEQGHFGAVKLDGLRGVGIYRWPGAVHQGNGVMQLVVDKRADEQQREALVKIMSGQETEDVATMWWVYGAMSPTKFPPIFETIDFEVDVDARHARLVVAGIVESVGEPIRNLVTGAEHRARIDLPHGFEYRLAEIGSGRTRTHGKVELDLTDTYGQFARIHLSNKGVIEAARA